MVYIPYTGSKPCQISCTAWRSTDKAKGLSTEYSLDLRIEVNLVRRVLVSDDRHQKLRLCVVGGFLGSVTGGAAAIFLEKGQIRVHCEIMKEGVEKFPSTLLISNSEIILRGQAGIQS